MTQRIHFTKMQGAGNDYIYVDASLYHIEDPASAAIAWSDRHNGIGADGLVLIGPADTNDADFSMRIFNADGSEARMCGNASRCIGKYVFEKGLTTKTKIRLQTLSGVKTLMLKPSSSLEPAESGGIESVTVDMGKPVLADEKQFRPMESLMEGTFVSMGNPHYVIFTDDVEQVEELGSKLEFHEAF
ncbi:MAG: diaminopimelate epimerase, partial [Bacteroidaceae bacterium]|nr:diaminopimelate epimerase [Bacteroidaceae bacterium]